MKKILSLLIAAYLISGCADTGIAHEDGPAAKKGSEGPALCRDGTTPPCNDRN